MKIGDTFVMSDDSKHGLRVLLANGKPFLALLLGGALEGHGLS